MQQIRFVRCFTALLALAPLASAGVITGRVVDFTGAGVANVNINADFSSGGGNPTLLNDGTDLNGFFTTTITPNGVFDISFLPPAPPLTTHLIKDLFDVPVVGTVDLGVIVLPRGYGLSGRIVNPASVGVADVNLDVIDAAGNSLVLQNDLSGPTGSFSVAVPLGALTLRLDPSLVVGQTLAPQSIGINLGGATNVGNVLLPAGFALSGLARRTNLTAVAGVDIDVYDSASGAKLFTPGDQSSATGNFSVIVPAGTFDVRLCPPFAQLLVATEFKNQAVNGPINFGGVTLQNGVLLSGIVQAFNGLKYSGVDVDVKFSASGAPVVLCNDNTSSSGAYQVIVPLGTLDVRFTPPYALPLASQFWSNVLVAGNKTINGTLPSCPFYTNSGTGSAGTGAVIPQLSATGGAPRLGNPDYALRLTNGRGGASALVFWTPSVAAQPPAGPQFTARGGLRLVPLSGIPGAAGAGSAAVAMPLGSQASLIGATLSARAYVLDPSATNGKAFTPYVNATFLP